MSLDGQGYVISVDIQGDGGSGFYCDCGGFVSTASKARFGKCDSGHFVCCICHRKARRFRKGLTCGFGCKPTGNK